ncbi:MAG: hypothetical protein JNM78_07260 [Cyclobacteriaceae bacterium]|nr:hypothetical protein [Cyclobacteriaceae bacterium]
MKYFILLICILSSCTTKSVDIIHGEFGVAGNEMLPPGNHHLRQGIEVYIYDVKENTYTDSLDFFTKDNEEHSAEFTANFYIPEENVIIVHTSVGQDFLNKSVIPETRASIRRILGLITSDSLLFTSRDSIESEIKKDLQFILIERGIALTKFELNRIIYPSELITVVRLNLGTEYRILKTSRNWIEKRRAIDQLLKSESKDILKIILRTYNEDKDQKTRDYILEHVTSSYRK